MSAPCFCPWSSGLVVLGPVVRRNNKAERFGGRGYLPPSGQDSRGRGYGQDPKILFKGLSR